MLKSKWKQNITVRTVPKSNRKMVETEVKMDIKNGRNWGENGY